MCSGCVPNMGSVLGIRTYVCIGMYSECVMHCGCMSTVGDVGTVRSHLSAHIHSA